MLLWCRFPFEQRAHLAKNAAGRQLFELMVKKQSNLAVAADVATAEEMLKLADLVRPPKECAMSGCEGPGISVKHR